MFKCSIIFVQKIHKIWWLFYIFCHKMYTNIFEVGGSFECIPSRFWLVPYFIALVDFWFYHTFDILLKKKSFSRRKLFTNHKVRCFVFIPPVQNSVRGNVAGTLEYGNQNKLQLLQGRTNCRPNFIISIIIMQMFTPRKSNKVYTL